MTDKLSIYNAALAHLGERKLANLSEERKARRDLDTSWDNGLVRGCLEMGQWNFGTRSSLLDYSPSVEPDFGFRRAFEHPDDWVRTTNISSDEFQNTEMTSNDFRDEAGFWFADIDTIYVSYISDDPEYGFDYGKWPQSFADYVALQLADRAGTVITQDERVIMRVERRAASARVSAKGIDAQNGPAEIQPNGDWVKARIGGRSSRERGNPGSLIG